MLPQQCHAQSLSHTRTPPSSRRYKKKFKALDTKPRLERLPIVLSTSLFYALMMCPVAYLAASPVAAAAGVWNLKSKASIVSSVGLSLMYYGGFIEAFADYEKSVHKRNLTAGKGGKPWIATGEVRCCAVRARPRH